MTNAVDLDLDLIHETDAAFLVGDGDGEVWLPKSLVTMTSDGSFLVPTWLAQKEGLI